MTVNTSRSVLILLAATLSIAGCKPDAAVKKGELIDRGTKQPERPGTLPPSVISSPGVDATQLGSVTGVVHFNGKAPARVPIDMSMDPACAMSAGQNLSEQYVVTGGKLANVFLYIKQGATPSMAPAGQPPVILDQKGCRYVPHVIAVQQGGSVEFRNSDPTMHNIHAMPATVGNEAVDVSQGPMGQPQIRQFKSAELMMPVRCNNHPWMSAFVNVADTPYFAVSALDGTFSISGLPPGSYTIAAVHEKLGEEDFPLTITAKGTTKLDVTFAAK